MYRTNQDFVAALDRAGELQRISARVSPVLEIAAVADRESKLPAPHPGSRRTRLTDPRFFHLGGKALLFENVEGSDIPVLINQFGSYRRIEMALGCAEPGPGNDGGPTAGGLEGLAEKIGALVKPEPPRSLAEAFARARQFLPLLRIPPRRRRGTGLCQEVVHTGEGVDLTRLPLIRCWPHDGDFGSVGYPPGINDHVAGLERGAEWERSFRGRYITLGGVHTVHAEDAESPRPHSHNIGMYRVQLLGKRSMAMHWHVHHDGARHWRSWKALGKPMPVAIALGGESVLPYAGTSPLPPGISELLLAGFLNGRGIELVRAKTVPLWVPANAEIVIEGYVRSEAGGVGWRPEEIVRSTQSPVDWRKELGPGAVFEGPFGDHTGFYSMPDRYPLLEVTAITHRRRPIFPATIVGLPPQEDYFLGKATERLFLPLLKTIIPDIEDYDLPLFGAFHNCACVKIKKQYPTQARRVMHSVWGAGQMAWTKTVFVVDASVDVHDASAVMRAAAEHCKPSRDIERVNGPLDILDHAAPRLGVGMKAGFDCTKKIEGEDLDGEPIESARVAPGSRTIVEAASAIAGVAGASCPESGASGWLFVRAATKQPRQGLAIGRAVARAVGERADPPRFVVVVGERVNIDAVDEAMFHWLANSDASRDWELVGSVLVCDATAKAAHDGTLQRPVRAWPPILEMPESIREKVRELAGGG